jgi:hypothetical protein
VRAAAHGVLTTRSQAVAIMGERRRLRGARLPEGKTWSHFVYASQPACGPAC